MLHLIVFLLTFLHSVVFINSVCDDYVVYWRIILYLTVFQLYTVHLYLSVSRSIDVTVVPPFLPVKIWSRVFQSCLFHPRDLVPRFPVPRFQRPRAENESRANTIGARMEATWVRRRLVWRTIITGLLISTLTLQRCTSEVISPF